MKTEFFDCERRTYPELPANQDNQYNHRQRHRERKPLERLIAKA
jgi:hypothetical protein